MAFRIPLAQLAFLACLFTGGLHAETHAQSLPLLTGPVLPLYRALRTVGLDTQRTYKIREAPIDRDDIHISLEDGTIAFTESIEGRITGAFFAGEGEILIRPPNRRERASLGLFTGQGVLNEHFSSVYLRFNDDVFAELQPYLRPADEAVSFVAGNETTARNLAAMDAMRLAISFTSSQPTARSGGPEPLPDRLLHARVASERLGTFDVYFDSRAPEQIVVGQVTTLHDESYYNLWMSFPVRALRTEDASYSRFHGPTGPTWTRDVFRVSSFTISAAIDASLGLSANATLEGTIHQGGSRIVLFELSRYLQLRSVESDGEKLEFIQNDAIEGSQLARRGNDLMAVVFPQPLTPAKQLRLTFTYSGAVLSDAGGGLFYVGARGTWYPNRGIAMANYDITFRFPQSYTLVATGTQVSLQQQGGESVGHWVSEIPIPIAGFNLGRYVRSAAEAGEVKVSSYATRGVEKELTKPTPVTSNSGSPSPLPPDISGPLGSRQAGPDPSAAGAQLVSRAADTIESLAAILGPYPFSSLSLTQRPGADSQGWPGIIFLSSYVYLTAEQRAAAHVSPADNVLYGEVMLRHEIGHQWFGDQVSWATYHEQWLLEALANYMALMLLEKRNPQDVQLMLQAYRQLLATKSKDGLPNVEAGPVTLGVRLTSSKFPAGYEVITYGRGTWLLHMVREMFRDGSRTPNHPEGSDEAFLGLLRTICERYRGKEITNADFEQAVEEILPKSLWFENHRSLDWFFDGWVNGTVLPLLELSDPRFSEDKGKVSITVRQLDAPEDLVTSVPIYGVSGEKKVFLGRVFAEGPETRVTLAIPPGIKRLQLDPYQTVLTKP